MAWIFVVNRPDARFNLFFDQVLPEPGGHSHAEGIPALAPLFGIVPELIKPGAESDSSELGGLERARQCEAIFLSKSERGLDRHIALPGLRGCRVTRLSLGNQARTAQKSNGGALDNGVHYIVDSVRPHSFQRWSAVNDGLTFRYSA